MVLLAAACAPAESPARPLAPDERAPVQAYLESVTQLNRQGRDTRLQLRWWVVGVPAVLWENRGNPRNQLADLRQQENVLGALAQRARAIESVPAPAAPAHAALLESYAATLRLLQAHGQVILETVQALDRGARPPDRETGEAGLRSARGEADRATAAAEHQLAELLRRLEATPPR